MNTVEFTVYGSPKPAGSKRAFVSGGRARVVDANPKAKPWKQQVTQMAIDSQFNETEDPGLPVFSDGPVSLSLLFVLKRPKAHYRSNGDLKLDAPHFHTNAPDGLKLARGVEDALSGVAYRDDSQVARLTVLKQYGEPERVEILVRPMAGTA